MTTFQRTIDLRSHGKSTSFLDVTDEVRSAIAASGISRGTCSVISPHTTCAIYFDEFAHDQLEDGTDFLQADLDAALSRISPPRPASRRPRDICTRGRSTSPRWRPGSTRDTYLPGGDRSQLLNADAHLKANVIGSSEDDSAVIEGRAAFGSTGYLFFVDFDRARARDRKCHIVVTGD